MYVVLVVKGGEGLKDLENLRKLLDDPRRKGVSFQNQKRSFFFFFISTCYYVELALKFSKFQYLRSGFSFVKYS